SKIDTTRKNADTSGAYTPSFTCTWVNGTVTVLNSCGTPAMKKAAATMPGPDPAPPTITMATSSSDCRRTNGSVLVRVPGAFLNASRAPANPTMAPDSV